MTVIDEVLTAEKAADEKLAQAKEAATQALVAAKKAQAEALEAEKARLTEVEQVALTAHTKHVAEQAQKITQEAGAKVQAVEGVFAAKKTEITQKIKQALA